jgi:very-short-patch-repair endonuclease
MKPYNKTLKAPARHLRSNMTDAEQMLWNHIRGKQIHGVQFNRQKPVSNYNVDFYCARARLILELDGGQHFEAGHKEKDKARDKAILKPGLLVLRFDNYQVLMETDSVLESIHAHVEIRLQHD